MAIPASITTVKARTFSNFISAAPAGIAAIQNNRGTFDSLSTSKLTTGFLAAVKNETDVSPPKHYMARLR